jgi:predicted acetyltransferase
VDITFHKVEKKDSDILERLFQFFKYDTSYLSGADIGDDGLYHGLNDIIDYSSKDNYYSCFIKVDGKLAGVFVIRFEEELNYLRHFFIMRNYRRKKIGTRSVFMIFNMFFGRWRVSSMDFNHPATEFWRNVCCLYTKGIYNEMRRDDNKGPQFEFVRKEL